MEAFMVFVNLILDDHKIKVFTNTFIEFTGHLKVLKLHKNLKSTYRFREAMFEQSMIILTAKIGQTVRIMYENGLPSPCIHMCDAGPYITADM